MSSREPRVGVGSAEDDELLRVSMLAAQMALGCSVVALVGREGDGSLFILPAPKLGVELMRALADADWATMCRLAEEHCS